MNASFFNKLHDKKGQTDSVIPPKGAVAKLEKKTKTVMSVEDPVIGAKAGIQNIIT